MIPLDYRSVRSNNNDDLLKYVSLIIITDNRRGKRDRPLAVKYLFVPEFLTPRIFKRRSCGNINYYAVGKLCDVERYLPESNCTFRLATSTKEHRDFATRFISS